jgi:hypothetical protein
MEDSGDCRPLRKPRIVVTGFIGLFPFGGVIWDYMQYVAGFAKLGCDVIYLEDTGAWPVYQNEIDAALNVAHVAAAMEHFGFGDRWAYRDAVTGQCFGMSETALKEFCRSADVFLNLSCSAMLREEYARIEVRALVDTDPMFTQIQYLRDESLDGGPTGMRELIENHTHHFSFGERIGSDGCRIPTLGLQWHPTRQPIVLDFWPVRETPNGSSCYSTVMNWRVVDDVIFDGERWGQKDVEFMRFLGLPGLVPSIPLGVAVSLTPESRFPATAARLAGWAVLDPSVCAHDASSYQDFIVNSRGEFSVAKQTYVKANTGWFSCRSGCYLAAGRPVVTQDTAWSQQLPTGRGLLAFHDEASAIEALRQVDSDPQRHSHAAREIAHEYFDSDVVLSEMLSRMGW